MEAVGVGAAATLIGSRFTKLAFVRWGSIGESDERHRYRCLGHAGGDAVPRHSELHPQPGEPDHPTFDNFEKMLSDYDIARQLRSSFCCWPAPRRQGG